VLLAGSGGGSGSRAGTAPDGSKYLDGVLTTVSDSELVLTPSDGSSPVRFELRPIDARRLDLFHLELHARDRLPSRVFFTEEGDARTVLRVDDL
jgi:hypothetical protein